MKEFLRGRWLGHPLHPLLVHVPVSLWPASLAFDVLALADIGGNAMVQASFYAIVTGLAFALLAVPVGFADWWGIKRENRAWTLGVYHMILNLSAAAVWTVNAMLRWDVSRTDTSVAAVPLMLSIAGTALVLVSGYLGGRMVYDYGISVARLSRGQLRRAAEAGGANLPPE